jgi:hypothetical protein
MNGHFFFSIFTADGASYGKADVDVDLAAPPPVGALVDLNDLTARPVPVGRRIDLTVIDVESRSDYVGIELSDLVAESKPEAEALCSTLQTLGFDCDVWRR